MVTDRPSHSSRTRGTLDTSVPHSARIFSYWLGGKDNYLADREAGDRFRMTFPKIIGMTRCSRQFLGRAVRYLADEAGIRQFLDAGTGLPTLDNTHEVAQQVAPESRIVYADNDPLVLVHAQVLLSSSPEGRTDYIDADIRDPETVLCMAAETLDLTRPVAVILMGILAHVADYDQARSIVNRLMAGLPPGSFLAIRDGTTTDPAYRAAIREYNVSGAVPYHLRTPDQIAGYFDGLEVVPPGVVPCQRWRPEGPFTGHRDEFAVLGGVARKP